MVYVVIESLTKQIECSGLPNSPLLQQLVPLCWATSCRTMSFGAYQTSSVGFQIRWPTLVNGKRKTSVPWHGIKPDISSCNSNFAIFDCFGRRRKRKEKDKWEKKEKERKKENKGKRKQRREERNTEEDVKKETKRKEWKRKWNWERKARRKKKRNKSKKPTTFQQINTSMTWSTNHHKSKMVVVPWCKFPPWTWSYTGCLTHGFMMPAKPFVLPLPA